MDGARGMFFASGRCAIARRTDVKTADLRARCCCGLHGDAGCRGGSSAGALGGTGQRIARCTMYCVLGTLCRKAVVGDQCVGLDTDDAD
jgi:hypothetical protein